MEFRYSSDQFRYWDVRPLLHIDSYRAQTRHRLQMSVIIVTFAFILADVIFGPISGTWHPLRTFVANNTSTPNDMASRNFCTIASTPDPDIAGIGAISTIGKNWFPGSSGSIWSSTFGSPRRSSGGQRSSAISLCELGHYNHCNCS